MPDPCGLQPSGFYCLAHLGHHGDHDFAGTVTLPGMAPGSRSKARRASRRALVAEMGEAAASAAVKAGRRSRDKGRRGEVEVRDIWRAHGWVDAARSPGSGSLRPYGAGDVSPWPGDLVGTGRWIVEVKRDERAAAGSRGWTGSAFVRSTCRRLQGLMRMHNAVMTGLEPAWACAWIRASRTDWAVWVPTSLLDTVLGRVYDYRPGWRDAWAAVPVEVFFAVVAGRPVVTGRKR